MFVVVLMRGLKVKKHLKQKIMFKRRLGFIFLFHYFYLVKEILKNNIDWITLKGRKIF